MKTKSPNFNLRVYGLFFNPKGEILISDEFQLGQKMTKFPGGGLKQGEGLIDCLIREMREECNQEIKNIRHFYTTDFYQKALFYENTQLISIYYIADLVEPINIKTSTNAFDFNELKNGQQSFRWVNPHNFTENELTFPIDRHVFGLIREASIPGQSNI